VHAQGLRFRRDANVTCLKRHIQGVTKWDGKRFAYMRYSQFLQLGLPVDKLNEPCESVAIRDNNKLSHPEGCQLKMTRPLQPIDYAVRWIQRALSNVQNDCFTPAAPSREIPDYLIELTLAHPDDSSEFSKFVLTLKYGALEQELLRQILPENLRQSIVDWRKEHHDLQIKKENEIAEQNFDNARDCLNREHQLANSIRKLIANQELEVTPTHIDSALKALGFNG
jgi:hypothetical protein